MPPANWKRIWFFGDFGSAFIRGWSPAVAFSPDGKRLASAGEEVKMWDAQTGQELFLLNGGGTSVAFSPDGKRLACGYWKDKAIKVWDAHTGQQFLILKGHTDGVTGVAFSPDSKRLASVSGDQTVRVWDTQTGQEFLTLKGHTDGVTGVAFSPDGKHLAIASRDKTVKVWDAQTGRGLFTLKGTPALSSAWPSVGLRGRRSPEVALAGVGGPLGVNRSLGSALRASCLMLS